MNKEIEGGTTAQNVKLLKNYEYLQVLRVSKCSKQIPLQFLYILKFDLKCKLSACIFILSTTNNKKFLNYKLMKIVYKFKMIICKTKSCD